MISFRKIQIYTITTFSYIQIPVFTPSYIEFNGTIMIFGKHRKRDANSLHHLVPSFWALAVIFHYLQSEKKSCKCFSGF